MSKGQDSGLTKSEPSYLLADRDYADVAHLENPTVIEHILSSSRREVSEYVCGLLGSGVSRYVVAGPQVAVKAMVLEALADLWKQISEWRKTEKIPADFSGRPSGYQTWVDLLREIDANPVDAERLKAMKAMFLAANRVNTSDGESILAYQLFHIAKDLNSGELFLLAAIHKTFKAGGLPREALSHSASSWRQKMAQIVGHGLEALVEQNERKLVEHGLLSAVVMSGQLETIREQNARLTDLGLRFCDNISTYELDAGSGDGTRRTDE